MRVFSKEEFNGQLPSPVGEFVEALASTLPSLGSYRIPADSGRKTALSKLLERALFEDSEVMVWINGWSIFQSSEHLDLFYGYRKSLGEERLLIQAAVHIFDGEGDKAAFISIVSMALYFVWDARIFDRNGAFLISISNDEFLDLYANEPVSARLKEAIKYFELEPLSGSDYFHSLHND